jgi:hypothetical protein
LDILQLQFVLRQAGVACFAFVLRSEMGYPPENLLRRDLDGQCGSVTREGRSILVVGAALTLAAREAEDADARIRCALHVVRFLLVKHVVRFHDVMHVFGDNKARSA